MAGVGFGGEDGREVWGGVADGLAGLLEPDGEAEELGELVGHLFTPGEGGLVEEGGVCLGEGGEGDAVFAFGEAFEDGDEHEGPEQGEGDDAERQPGGDAMGGGMRHDRRRWGVACQVGVGASSGEGGVVVFCPRLRGCGQFSTLLSAWSFCLRPVICGSAWIRFILNFK